MGQEAQSKSMAILVPVFSLQEYLLFSTVNFYGVGNTNQNGFLFNENKSLHLLG